MGKVKDTCPITGLPSKWYGLFDPYDNGDLCTLESYRESKYRWAYKRFISRIRKNKRQKQNENNKLR